MKSRKKEFKIDFDFEWEYGVEINKLRDDLDELEKLGATNINIKADIYYSCTNFFRIWL